MCNRNLLLLLLLVHAFAGCSKRPSDGDVPGVAAPAVSLPGLPIDMTVAQRTTTRIPHSKRRLFLTLGDITAGQVTVNLTDADGKPLFGPVSMREGDANSFEFDGKPYSLRLMELANEIIGTDSALFVIDEMPVLKTGGPVEHETIERLIAAVESQADLVFIRNGQEHTGAEAAEHLRRKLEAAEGQVTTADDFIEHVASRSSATGAAYIIRWPDGRTETSAEYLTRKLRGIEAGDRELPRGP